MEARSRSINRFTYGGVGFEQGDPENIQAGPFSYSHESRTINDFWKKDKRSNGTLPPSNLDLRVIERYPMVLQVRDHFINFDDWAIGGGYTPGLPYNITGTSARYHENEKFVLELCKRTYPLAPIYSVPVAIKEFVELSTLFSIAMKGFISYLGNSYLMYRFGWMSFYNDIRTLSNITRRIESRVREFNSMAEHGDLRRRVDIYSVKSQEVATNQLWHSTYGITIRGDATYYYSYKVWGSVHWRPLPDYPMPVDDIGRWNLAVKSAFDLGEVDPETMWNLIPWSWLIDYFVDLGSYLETLEYTKFLRPYDICIMREHQTRVVRKWDGKPGVTGKLDGTFIHTAKQRDVWDDSLSIQPAGFELLTTSELTVITALLAKFHR